ncbi:MAG: hypothetical protein IRY97_03660 [Thermomicrobiaceae bacterium]|nr:hypothetical protein [Thermomicrobiaceae bacterium]
MAAIAIIQTWQGEGRSRPPARPSREGQQGAVDLDAAGGAGLPSTAHRSLYRCPARESSRGACPA